MTTKNSKREQLSALADGELDELLSETLLKDLDDEEDIKDWELYHRIGDTLRSEELAAPLSAGFAARMAARLEAEVPHQPVSALVKNKDETSAEAGGVLAVLRRYLVPCTIGTAAVLVAAMMVPQWGADMPVATEAPIAVQVPEGAGEGTGAAVIPVLVPEKEAAKPVVSDSQTLVAEDDIVRDPRIDQYLMAHQRISPGAYSRSQFARSATFATEADK